MRNEFSSFNNMVNESKVKIQLLLSKLDETRKAVDTQKAKNQ